MSDMPEQIYADPKTGQWFAHQSGCNYVRADLHAELEAEVALLRRTNVELQQFINERANERDEWKARAKALSRTGAVKVLTGTEFTLVLRDDAVSLWCSTSEDAQRVYSAIESLSALEPAALEGQRMPNPAPIKAWRIKKSEPIPQWLEKTENVELTAGCDLIVIEAEDGGFDVYRSDPNSFANMMEGTCTDPGKHATVTGAPTNLRMPSVLEAQINKLQAEINELTRTAPEGQQEPVAYRIHAPEDEHYGTGPDRLQFHPLAQYDLDNGYRQTPLYTRPAEQAVTEAEHE